MRSEMFLCECRVSAPFENNKHQIARLRKKMLLMAALLPLTTDRDNVIRFSGFGDAHSV